MTTENQKPEATNPDAQSGLSSASLLACAVQLLKVATCPNCDGSGATAEQRSSRQLVTREMAMDAGCPEMEGSIAPDEEWEQVQCQWCDEKFKVITAYEAQANESGSP